MVPMKEIAPSGRAQSEGRCGVLVSSFSARNYTRRVVRFSGEEMAWISCEKLLEIF